mmetsp:Transcript_282/g.690  ORF Transcript_282/g.690 Transcript_282/m.690 type:complete len:94 (-) Transcript_282:1440-1721(-)
MSFLKKTGKAMADVIPGLGKLTFDDDLGKIFVTSGTGVVGYRVAMSLLEQGQKEVRVSAGVIRLHQQGYYCSISIHYHVLTIPPVFPPPLPFS